MRNIYSGMLICRTFYPIKRINYVFEKYVYQEKRIYRLDSLFVWKEKKRKEKRIFVGISRHFILKMLVRNHGYHAIPPSPALSAEKNLNSCPSRTGIRQFISARPFLAPQLGFPTVYIIHVTAPAEWIKMANIHIQHC